MPALLRANSCLPASINGSLKLIAITKYVSSFYTYIRTVVNGIEHKPSRASTKTPTLGVIKPNDIEA